jgi:putative ABC transport system permease protein
MSAAPPSVPTRRFSVARGRLLPFYALGGALREQLGRTLLALIAIALGVALGVAVHVINASALNEFSVAARHLAGEADLIIRGPRAGFDEALYPRIARLPQVEAANPAIELDVSIAGVEGSLRLIGFDALRAAQVQPALLPEKTGALADLFSDDAIFLSSSAARWLNLKTGDALRVSVGTGIVTLEVAGILPEGTYRQRIGVMDVAAAQWRLQRLGRLNRIDLRLKPGVLATAFERDLQSALPPGVQVTTPSTDAGRGASLSRAYRLNLDMLAMIALFAGSFLVFSSQMLAILRRRTQFALLRALGMTRRALAAWLVAEAAALGAIGAALGVALGYTVARAVLAQFGADLGAGYFRSVVPALHIDPLVLLVYFALGVGFALLGAAAPALEAARRAPARGLRAGDEEESLKAVRTGPAGAAFLATGSMLTFAPPVDGLPIAGYSAIALVLFGAMLLTPRFVSGVLKHVPAFRFPPAALAVWQLRATPRQIAVSVAAIVASFSLMVAMLIMVHSFRNSLESWLERMLPADLYLRTLRGGETGFITPEEQARIRATPGIERLEFLRSQNLLLAPDRPPVVLLAGPADAARMLLLVGTSVTPRLEEPPPVWISEIAADLYGWRTGARVQLPIGAAPREFTVAGVWRDYARQGGAIAIDRRLYARLTGDPLVNDAAIWVAPGVAPSALERALRERLGHAEGIEIASPRELRATSLALFDRTFAVTYALEVAALVIGLFGISVSFGAQALSRRREFGMLRHVGMTRSGIGAMLGWEGSVVSVLGASLGLALGWVTSLILIHVVNRQSFHWSMDFHFPWLPLAALAAVLIAASIATAVWSGRAAMGEDVVQAVREDW